jgi:SAM-dependent methyltransferase
MSRLAPRLWHSSYLALSANRQVMEIFRGCVMGSDKSTPQLLDIGCGHKPFATLFPNTQYIGTDVSRVDAAPDLIADNVALPFADASFDGCIASETLEHTRSYETAVAEMIRVTRGGGYLYISVPFVHPLHHHPCDFQRISEYRWVDLFSEHTILMLKPSNTIFSTWLTSLAFAIRVALSVVPFAPVLFAPIALSLNAMSVVIDWLARAVLSVALVVPTLRERLTSRIRHPRSIEGIVTSMPCGYAMVVQVNRAT